jgi:prepilin-type N-terminal cleavage/methylation domain-containing protein
MISLTFRQRRGFTLIEVVLGVVLVALVVGFFYQMFSQGATISRRIRDSQIVTGLDRQIFTDVKSALLDGTSLLSLQESSILNLNVPEQSGFRLVSAVRKLSIDLVDDAELVVLKTKITYEVFSGEEVYEGLWYFKPPGALQI